MIDLLFNLIIITSNYIDSNYYFFFLIYFIFSIIFFSLSLPGGLLVSLASGFFFGFIPGFLINVLSTSLGSLIFIIFSKTILKKIFEKYYHKYSEGVLFVDLIDYKKNELIWQGIGKGYIPSKRAKKEEQIKLFVNKILIQYPPQY